MNIVSLGDGTLKGTICLANGILEHILAVHPHGIEGRKPGNLFSSRVEESNPPFGIGCEKTVRDAIENFNKALFLVVYPLQGLEIVSLNLFFDEMIKTPWVSKASGLEIRTGKTGTQLLEEIFSQVITAVRPGNEPALQGLLPMGRTKEFGTGQILPAWLLLAAPALLSGDV